MAKKIVLPKIAEALFTIQGFSVEHFTTDKFGKPKENAELFLVSYIKLVETIKIIENFLRPLNRDLLNALSFFEYDRFAYRLTDYDVVCRVTELKRVMLTETQRKYLLNHPLKYPLYVNRTINEARIYNNIFYNAVPEFKIPIDDTPIAISSDKIPKVDFVKRDFKKKK